MTVGAQAPEGDFGLINGVAEASRGLQAGCGPRGAVHLDDLAAAAAHEVVAVVVADGDNRRSLHKADPTGRDTNQRVLLRRC